MELLAKKQKEEVEKFLAEAHYNFTGLTKAATAGWRIEGSRVLKLEVMVEHETEYKLEVEIHLGVTYCDTLEELWIED
ncbi:hypothetical protein QL285_074410 [Trifolium repens]|nr:hypothetical protein QL285_074410 [Trifolium repens]